MLNSDPLGLFAPAIPLVPIAWGALVEAVAWVGGGIVTLFAAKEISDAITDSKTEELTKCDTQKPKCPPCVTVTGKIVPLETMGYRPLDIIPDDEMQHG